MDRRVSFFESVRVRRYLHKRDMSKAEIRSSWYSSDELSMIQSNIRRGDDEHFGYQHLCEDDTLSSPTTDDQVEKLQKSRQDFAVSVHSPEESTSPESSPISSPTESVEAMNVAMLEAFPSPTFAKRRLLRNIKPPSL